MLNITDSAKDKISDLIREENNPSLVLRTFIQGGGCSGFNYGFTFDEEVNDDDFTIDIGDCRVVVDSMSMQYLDGATIDYKTEKFNSQFVITNPNAKTTCGCGSSFSV